MTTTFTTTIYINGHTCSSCIWSRMISFLRILMCSTTYVHMYTTKSDIWRIQMSTTNLYLFTLFMKCNGLFDLSWLVLSTIMISAAFTISCITRVQHKKMCCAHFCIGMANNPMFAYKFSVHAVYAQKNSS